MEKKRITKVYTKTGDKGQTSLVGGSRVSKASLRVHAYGEVDELNAVLGMARSLLNDGEINDLLAQIQNDLFIVGADLASPPDVNVPRITKEAVTRLESIMDRFLEELEPLKEFILPSGTPGGSCLHLARTVCRRAERKVVELVEEKGEGVSSNVPVYLNRLSDLLFILARGQNRTSGFEETFVKFNSPKGSTEL